MDTVESIRSWVSTHKLTSIGAIWASAIGASMAYTGSRTALKPSLRLIHASSLSLLRQELQKARGGSQCLVEEIIYVIYSNQSALFSK
ncbi:hypothetical protein V6Z12_D10G213800 [Gossypium hirsutum]